MSKLFNRRYRITVKWGIITIRSPISNATVWSIYDDKIYDVGLNVCGDGIDEVLTFIKEKLDHEQYYKIERYLYRNTL